MQQMDGSDLARFGYTSLVATRAEDVACLAATGSSSVVRRLDVVLTYRCNLKCPYCRFPVGPRAVVPAELSARMDRAGSDLRWVHLSGGEPTCHPELLRVVRDIKERGLHLTITSNGAAPADTYAELVRAGTDEINISLDSHRSAGLGSVFRERALFDAVLANLELLGDLCASQGRILRVNACIDESDLPRVVEIVGRFSACSPSDIKLVTIVQSDGFSADTRATYLRDTAPSLAAVAEQRSYPMLGYRATRLLSPDFRGVHGRQAPRCFFVLDELCCDDRDYYPCIIYFREGGRPIGSLTGRPWSEVLAERRRFFGAFVPERDRICQRCCPDVTRSYNAFAEARFARLGALKVSVCPEASAEHPPPDTRSPRR